ncbi:ArsR/SmtB family transcription factor [Actinoallomurus sp. CA-150999]|uniref:ArsR/SmtB family transcription factor n=1 Tax=Actinoallomurus sp. CA-150999 TaxID=3239887 RepID=UPI003D8F19C5
MLRLRFTADDLLRVRYATGPAPLLELGMALATLQRHDAVFARWARRTRLPRTAFPLFELIPPSATGPLFVDPVSEGFEDGLDMVLSTPHDHARAELVRTCRPTSLPRRLADRDRDAWRTLEHALRDAYGAVIGQDEPRIRASYDADLAWRRVVTAEQGIGAALAGLYPGSHWEGTDLVVDVPEDSEHAPRGRGLTLMPSVFWTGRPLIGTHTDGSMLLVYPALTPVPLVDTEPPDALAALLGRTRAAVLSMLVEYRTTSELALTLGISVASASTHAKTLRGAGLVATRRAGKAVRHVATPLGLRLLRRGLTS